MLDKGAVVASPVGSVIGGTDQLELAILAGHRVSH